ncbi:MAG: ABC transporter ATP-binding protein [Acidimicrobiales bacterium]|nr:ABC transporter ATP-binding protein [Acidimicrobiales bacterium]
MIHVEGLVKDLGGRRVLDEISFNAPTGTITGLLGPNGAGKTTTMRILATLLVPDQGRVEIAGIDISRDPIGARRALGLVTEDPGLYDRLTVREQLTFTGRAYGLSSSTVAARIDQLASLLGMGDYLDERAGILSKGNRQKVSLSRALVHDPPILLLDEPTSGLDVVAAASLEKLLTLPEVTCGKTVLLSTHRLDEAERMATRVVGIAGGRVVVDATPEELAEAYGGSFREAFVQMLGRAELGG